MFAKSLTRTSRRRGLAFALAIVLPAAAVWAELLLSRIGGTGFLFLVSGVAVAVTAWYGGLWPGVVATAVAAIGVDYAFFAPGVLLQLGGVVQASALAAYVAGWVAVCALLHRDGMNRAADRSARAAAEAAASQSERAAQLTAALGRARSVSAVMEAALQESLHALGGDAAMLLLLDKDDESPSVPRA